MKSIILNQHQVNYALKNEEGVLRDCYNKGYQFNWWTKDHKQFLDEIIKSKFKVGETLFVK